MFVLTKADTVTTVPNSSMEPQRIRDIKKSLEDMNLEELQDMSDDLVALISVLMTRQVAIEDVILDRLEGAFTTVTWQDDA